MGYEKLRVGWASMLEKQRKCSSSRAWGVGSKVSTLDFVRRKIQEWVLFNLSHHHLLIKLHLLIWKSLRDPKKRAWISHLEPSMWASTLTKENPIRAMSGWSIEVRQPVWLLDINESFIPYLPAAEIIDPWKSVMSSELNRCDLKVRSDLGYRYDPYSFLFYIRFYI